MISKAQDFGHTSSIALLEPDLPPLDELTPYFSRVTESGRYSNFGPMVAALEARLAQTFYHDGPAHCVTASSGTTAIEIALQAMRIPPGARILTPAFGFPAAALAMLRMGYKPVFAGVSKETWQLSPSLADQIIASADIAAVMPVTSLGYAEDVEAWSRLSSRHGIPVIVDAAAALGNQPLSSRMAVISSMHATKALGIGEGGLIATTDKNLAERMRMLTNFGFENRLVMEAGGNAKLSEWHAAVAHAQLDRWKEIVSKRVKVRDLYRKHLSEMPLGLHPDTWTVKVPAFMPVRMPSSLVAEKLIAVLDSMAIGARRWFCPALPDHPALKDMPIFDSMENSIADTRELAASIICLPFHSRLQERDIQRVADGVRRVVPGI